MKAKRLAALAMAVLMTAGAVFAEIPVLAKETANVVSETEETAERSVINFNTDWHYKKGDVTNADKVDFADEKWGYVNLPHSTIFYTAENKDAYLGISWYRKHFTLDKSLEGKELKLTFEAAMQRAEVWINGEKVIDHKGGYIPFVIDLKDKVKFGEDNVIAVKINSRADSSFAPGKTAPDFQYFGGIYGNAFITVTDSVHISDALEADVTAGGGVFVTAPEVSETSATVKVKTHVENDSTENKDVTLVTEIIDEDGSVAASAEETKAIAGGQAEEYRQAVQVKNPRLWSPETPELYTVRTTVKIGDYTKDSVDTTYGIRKVEWKREGLFINGKKEDGSGANLHGETYMFANAMPDNAIYEEMKRFKENGFDILRMAHYPHRQAYYDAADKYGVMIVECPSGWQYFNNTESFRESTYSELRTIIRNHRNHPSIVAWETSLNETGYPYDWAVEMNRIAKEEYPEDGMTYAYTAGCYHWSVWDIGLSTPQAGIFGQGNEGAETPKNQEKPIIIAEYGDWNYGGSGSTTRVTRENKNSAGKKGGDEGMLIQATNAEESVQTNRSKGKEWLGASLYWQYADYAGFDRGIMNHCGVVDMYRIPKHASYFYRSQSPAERDMSAYGIETGPMVYIANTWDEKADSEVRIYSNCDTVELFLNGKSLGEKGHDTTIWGPHGDGNHQNYPANGAAKEISADSIPNAPITFDLEAYEPGELKAVAKIDGVEKAEYIRRTPGAATNIQLRPESDAPIALDGSSAKLVWIDLIDKNGTVDPNAYTDVNLEVEGPGLVVGPKTITTKGGQLAVWVKSKRGSGDITLKATGENLIEASVTIETEVVEGLPEVPEGGDADEYENQEQAPEEQHGIFYGKSVRASSENPSGKTGPETAVKANDGDEATKWCASSGSYPQWWEVDLGSTYNLETMKLAFETYGASYYYTIAVSDEPMTDETYAEHIVVDHSQGSTMTDFTFEDVKGRYVRVTFTKASNGEWAVLREVSGTGETDNVALGKPVSASSVNVGGKGVEKAEYANDGNQNTWWCAVGGAETSGHWWQVDLKDTYKLSEINIFMEKNDAAYKFVVQGSVDGKNYKTIKDFRNTEGCGQAIIVDTDQIAQYVRIYDISTKSPATQWPAIREVEVRGKKVEYKLTSVSREKEAFASSCGLDSIPAHGSNGVPGWYWYPASMGDEWWYIDTKGIYDLDNIQMTWNKGENHKYIIDISTDGKEWTTVVDRSEKGVDDVRPYEAVTGAARYVRVRMPGERTVDQGFGLFDAYAPAAAKRDVASVSEVEAVEVEAGTAFADLNLPKEIDVTLADGIKTTLPVTWNEADYKAEAGTYTVNGTLEAIDGVVLGDFTAVSVAVTVKETAEVEEANKTYLTALIGYAESQKLHEDYQYVIPVVKEAFEKALAEAVVVNENAAATQAEVDAAYDKLLSMTHYLGFTGDSKELKVTVDAAHELNEKLYTEETWAPFAKALAEAEAVLADENALQAEIDVANKVLNDAMHALVKKPVDKTKLQKLVEKSQKYEEAIKDYTPETAKLFEGALVHAKDILGREDVTQEEIDAAYTALQNAIFGLRLIPNKDKLEGLIKDAEAVDTADYTAESAAAFTAALDRAKLVFADENATEEQVKAAEKELKKAQKNLVAKADTKSQPKTGDTAPIVSMIVIMLGAAAGGILVYRRRKMK